MRKRISVWILILVLTVTGCAAAEPGAANAGPVSWGEIALDLVSSDSVTINIYLFEQLLLKYGQIEAGGSIDLNNDGQADVYVSAFSGESARVERRDGAKLLHVNYSISLDASKSREYYYTSVTFRLCPEVSFDAGGGSGSMASVLVGKGTEYTLPVCGFTAPADHAFDKWQVGGASHNPGDKIAVSADLTVKALWKSTEEPPQETEEPKKDTTYIIYFDNKPSKNKVYQIVEIGEETTLRKNPFTRKGYTFTGWNTKKNGSGKYYADRATITPDGSILMLYAQWAKGGKCTITLMPNYKGAPAKKKQIKAKAGKTITLPKNPFTRKWYKFKGWAVSPNKTAVTYKNRQKIQVTRSMTLNAVWQKKKITIAAKNKTYKATAKPKKYTVTVKCEGKVLKKHPVKLKINGKTYQNKTNAKGKVTFKIPIKKKGKYTATITVKTGNFTTQKKVKIIITK